jgi:putative membrane protein
MEKPQNSGQKASLSDYLAAERTLLAWIRTGLALMGFGFVVARFGLFLQEFQAAKIAVPVHPSGLSLHFGTALIALGVFVNILGGWHHIQLVRKLDRSEPTGSHGTFYAIAIAFILALVGIIMTIYLLSL